MELSYREWPSAGEPLVVLHGMLGSSRNWMTAGKDLADQGRRVIAPDARNHGASPHAAEMDYPAQAGDVIELLDRLELPRASLLGHSMGGKTAMWIACHHPKRVSRLIVVDIAPKNYRWVGHRQEFAAMGELDLAHLESRAEAELRMEARIPDWGLRKFLTTNLERTGDGWKWIVNLPAISAALPLLEKDSLRPNDRFEGPTRFIAGGRSNYVNPSNDLPVIRGYFPQADLTVLSNSGHNPHFEAREEFVQAVSG